MLSPRMKKVLIICFALFATPLIVIFVAGLFDSMGLSPIRAALPKSATEIQEFQWSSLGGDYTSLLKAKMPEGEVEAYAKQFGATILIEAATYENYSAELVGPNFKPQAAYKGESLGHVWSGDARAAWWNPPPKPRYFQFYRSGTTIAVVAVGWAVGWVYFSKWQGYGGEPPKAATK